MKQIIKETNWRTFLREYSQRNQGRPTRLGVFETRDGVANDYWIEDGLPLVAFDVYPDNAKTKVDIVFENYTHSIDGASGLVSINGSGTDQGLDILDAEGKATIIRFENWPARSED
jgi:hypothetical protein